MRITRTPCYNVFSDRLEETCYSTGSQFLAVQHHNVHKCMARCNTLPETHIQPLEKNRALLNFDTLTPFSLRYNVE